MNEPRKFTSDLKTQLLRGKEALQACWKRSLKWARRNLLRLQCRLALMMNSNAKIIQFEGIQLQVPVNKLDQATFTCQYKDGVISITLTINNATYPIPLTAENIQILSHFIDSFNGAFMKAINARFEEEYALSGVGNKIKQRKEDLNQSFSDKNNL